MKPTNLFLFGLGLLFPIHPNLWAQPVPHHFRDITVLADRSMALSLDGSVSNMFNLSGTISNQFMQMFDLYAVEASTNLADWTRLALLLRTNNNPNPLIVQDTNAASLSQRFYRAITNHLLTGFPKPSGPFAVGTVDRVMVDPARTNRYRYTPATNAFRVTFWYPADPPPAGTLPAAMWDKRWAADTSFISALAASGASGADTKWALIAPKLVGHRFSGVPLAVGAAKWPVVIYSHGWHATRQSASQMAEELASHGYVVVATDHPDCWATEFPDGRYLSGSTSGEVPGRLKDMQFLVDELARLDSGDTLFAGRLDLDRVGVSGLSAGGMVVETCRSDNRVKCAALWDATNLQLNSAGLQKPFLAAVAERTPFYSENQWLFNKAATHAVLLQIRGAEHVTGTDAAWTWEIPWGRGPALAFNACLVWFFDTYLKGEMPPFPTNPELYNVQRK
jgi:dienelactone hydrolase